MASGKWVAYYRVSTDRQGKSGLGLEGQRQAVTDFLNGGRWTVLGDFVEVESGKKSARPKMAEAIAMCRAMGAKLLIAKLDRLARNVFFVSSLMESGVEFVAVDNPQATRLTVHVLAAFAEHEAKMISERTKAALAAAKARGVKLGGARGRTATDEDRAKGVAAIKARAAARGADLAPIVAKLRAEGLMSATALAKRLADMGVPAARGGSNWTATQVRRLLAAQAS